VQVKAFLADVAKEVGKRMRDAKVKGKRINLKVAQPLTARHLCHTLPHVI
jgi:hypothetical protein